MRQLGQFCAFGLSLARHPLTPCWKVTNLLDSSSPGRPCHCHLVEPWIEILDAGKDWLTGKDRRLLTLLAPPAQQLAFERWCGPQVSEEVVVLVLVLVLVLVICWCWCWYWCWCWC